MSELNPTTAELARYGRQMALPQVGEEGQRRLGASRVLIVGAGGLGAPVSLYLAAAGVGQITLVDGDRVELSNLQRQVIFTTADIGLAKAEAAARRLGLLNPDIRIQAVSQHLTAANASELIKAADLVVDCCDNFATRYLINDFCRHLGRPWLFAAVHRFRGQLALFTPDTPCFRCLYPEPPRTEGNCSLAGVLGTVPGLLGSWQANEALKFLLGLPQSQPGRLWTWDALDPRVTTMGLTREPQCPCTGEPLDPATLHGWNLSDEEVELDWDQWRALEASAEDPLLIDVRSAVEHRAGNAGGLCLAREQISAQLEKNRTVGLYCQRGLRSLALARELRRRGFSRVFSLRGGLQSLPRESIQAK